MSSWSATPQSLCLCGGYRADRGSLVSLYKLQVPLKTIYVNVWMSLKHNRMMIFLHKFLFFLVIITLSSKIKITQRFVSKNSVTCWHIVLWWEKLPYESCKTLVKVLSKRECMAGIRRTLLILKEIPAPGRKFLHQTVPKKQNRNNSRIRTAHSVHIRQMKYGNNNYMHN